ncbi:hypothetical protein Ais01nite_21770 [Asanoa ishikariensis]|uniref:Major facilitator superfamily (MFS) profile domain-containing protein n=1 Tax=Asanoa ishikariensis TaxID=137265 RepID=A0A1H3U762_9ACTN|nr:hypothetical protein Ais01nite_21770 [Asanoa ishikariensis]SDZ58343.1 hypothetical protein SAMN05421684_6697 [Asanoa ishikariensis]
MNSADQRGPLISILTAGSVLTILAAIAALSWVYLARNDDWRGWVFALPSTTGVIAIILLRRLTRPTTSR